MTGATFNDMAGSSYAVDDLLYMDKFSTATAVSGDLMTLTYHIGAETAGTIITISGAGLAMTEQGNDVQLISGSVPMPEVVFTVPEPATMVLLGMGALVLRHKE